MFLNGFEDGPAAVVQFAQVAETGFQLTQLSIIQAAGDFFPVAGDKRDGISLIQQGNRGGDLAGLRIQFTGNNLAQRFIHHDILSGCDKLT
ncbi:Uncharacterised protein [Klebsiella pneumoniae]|nr:Uncharacterised protein [Klebsiella pneumoniae]